MKRWNLREAFIGEPSLEGENARRREAGYDAVELEVRRGKVTLVIPASAPDDSVFQPRTFAHPSTWELQLEGGWVVTFHLPEGVIEASVHLRSNE